METEYVTAKSQTFGHNSQVQALMPCFPYKAAWERERERVQELDVEFLTLFFWGKS